ncbi:MAG: PDZ domain-containing protein [Gammaproteobacteria bacterium]|nr:PDZ domain-containing protein [Gammaproteobacteria bacterium]
MKLVQFTIILCTGIIIGLFAQEYSSFTSSDTDTSLRIKTDITDFTEVQNKSNNHPLPEFSNQIELENEIKALRNKVSQLQHALKEQPQTNQPNSNNASEEKPPAQKLTKEVLVQIGVTESTADDILNRLGQYEYQLLELHDRAKREGYLNSARYARERRKLMENAPSLQQAIGKEYYDNYLYQTEQNNRIAVTTVLNDSPAAQLGVQKNDIILNYANEKILSWQQLRELTTSGAYGEYVNLNILRDGKMLNILVPRGPLGVKLEATRLDPLAEYTY